MNGTERLAKTLPVSTASFTRFHFGILLATPKLASGDSCSGRAGLPVVLVTEVASMPALGVVLGLGGGGSVIASGDRAPLPELERPGLNVALGLPGCGPGGGMGRRVRVTAAILRFSTAEVANEGETKTLALHRS